MGTRTQLEPVDDVEDTSLEQNVAISIDPDIQPVHFCPKSR